MPISEAYNMDCMEYMRTVADGFFDLAIVDPPYGIGAARKTRYHGNANTVYRKREWDDCIPKDEYFQELFRVSKHQIVWGGNYFDLPPMPKWIVWDKCQPEGIDQAMFELAWSSMTHVQSRVFYRSVNADNNKVSNGDRRAMMVAKRIHPTQKPVELYRWLLKNYAKPGDRILDTHLGSGSSRMAAYDMGYDFYATELDKDYFDQSCKRFETHKILHGNMMFKPEPPKAEQTKLFSELENQTRK